MAGDEVHHLAEEVYHEDYHVVLGLKEVSDKIKGDHGRSG